jgi:iron complex transport system substrate-binding protein
MTVRIVSLLPSVTEIVAALGREENLVGRTHECDFPASIAPVPVVTESRLEHDPLDGAAIDRAVSRALPDGGLYALRVDELERARPDLIITQELCDVCAVSVDEVQEVADGLPGRPEVLSLAPQTLEGVLASILAVGVAVGAGEEARRLVDDLRTRLDRVRDAVAVRPRVPVVCLEWLDPPYCAGHWVPDQVEAAGGKELLGRAGRPAVRIRPEAVAEADPEVLCLIPCGWSAREAARAAGRGLLGPYAGTRAARGGRILALDANAHFSRPGPRLVDGVEILAAVLHPGADLPGPGPDAAVPVAPGAPAAAR